MKHRKSKAWGSHLPVVLKVLQITDGPVLEMGMGPSSTPFMHWACFAHDRKLVSYDNDRDWFALNEQYRENNHEVYFVEDWDKIDIENEMWDVVLIDHKPAERRRFDIIRLANHAKYIIVHDTQWRQDHEYHYKKDVFPFFKYRFDFTKQKPYTTVLSNFVDLTNFNL